MYESIRQSMAWLHTWFGLVLGFVLMVVFFFGALSVFDREIDRWAIPETRFDPQRMPSFDNMLKPIFERIEPGEEQLEAARERIGKPLPDTLPVIEWSAYTTHRDPVLRLFAEFAVDNPENPNDHLHGHVTIDPRSGRILPHDQLRVGTGFFYPMHYNLHLHWNNLGIWIVGLAALVMLAVLVSGVVIHRRIFRELFTFRPRMRTQRSVLDLHNLTGVVALPFHFFFALTGLIIFAGIYFPVAQTLLQPMYEQFQQQEAETKGLPFQPAGRPAELASVDAMVREAKNRWADRGMPGEVGFLEVNHVGDENSYVSIYRAGSDRVTLVGQGLHFDGPTGRVLYEEPPASSIAAIDDFLAGLHLQHFEHWLLRWFYVLGGLTGCVCIATGFLYFVEKRKRKHAANGVSGSRIVDAFAVTTITGMLIASLAMLVANRLLPADIPHRGDWQEYIFWAAWLAALAHACWRSSPVLQARIAPAWSEQCWMVAGFAVSAVLLNWLTTGDHLLQTIGSGYWPVAGLDLAMLVTAGIAVLVAMRLRRRTRTPEPSPGQGGIRTDQNGLLPEADHA